MSNVTPEERIALQKKFAKAIADLANAVSAVKAMGYVQGLNDMGGAANAVPVPSEPRADAGSIGPSAAFAAAPTSRRKHK
jgi:hypothetical protein